MAIQRGCTFLSRSQDWNQRNNTDSRDVWCPKPTLLLGVECFWKRKEYFFFFSFLSFLLYQAASKILVSRPGTEPMFPAVDV